MRNNWTAWIGAISYLPSIRSFLDGEYVVGPVLDLHVAGKLEWAGWDTTMEELALKENCWALAKAWIFAVACWSIAKMAVLLDTSGSEGGTAFRLSFCSFLGLRFCSCLGHLTRCRSLASICWFISIIFIASCPTSSGTTTGSCCFLSFYFLCFCLFNASRRGSWCMREPSMKFGSLSLSSALRISAVNSSLWR